MAFAVISAARLSFSPPDGGPLTTPQASLHATDRSVAPPIGLSTLGFGARRFPLAPPACYRASWQLPGPDLHRQATTSLSLSVQLVGIISNCLGARIIEARRDYTPSRALRASSPIVRLVVGW